MPSLPVLIFLVSPVALLVTVTVALGTMAPCGSVTVPRIAPVGFCAMTGNASWATSDIIMMASSKRLYLIRILRLLSIPSERVRSPMSDRADTAMGSHCLGYALVHQV